MMTWLLSILGIGVLDVIVLHFTENTRMHKTVKMVCSIVFVFAIVLPLPGLISGTFEFDGISFDYSTEIDSTMPDIIHENQRKLIERSVERALADEGFAVVISVEAEFDGGDMKINRVTAHCEKYYYEIIGKISEYLDIDKEYIYIDVSNG